MMGGRSGGMMGGGTGGMMGGTGMMAGQGMMGSHGAMPSWTPGTTSGRVDAAQAQALADSWLAAQGTGLTAGEPDAFPGYYSMETLRDGKVAGMISVNARTGAVFYHWWHGAFVAMEE